MKTLQELINELRAVDSNVPGNAAAFEALLAQIVALRTPEYIVPLLGFLQDNSRHDELMFSIIHGLEIFDDKTYVKQIIRGSVALCSESPRWASIIFMRIINSESTRVELIRQLRNAEKNAKDSIRKLMEKINDRSVQFLPRTTAVILAAS